MPMVWYIPPLSPVVDAVSRGGHDGEDLGNLFGALEALRIPIEYLAGLFTAGDTGTVEAVLRRLCRDAVPHARHQSRRRPNLIPQAVGMTEEQIYAMYRLLAIAKYEGALRHSVGVRRRGPSIGGDGHRVCPVVRRWTGNVRVRSIRRGQRRAGARRGGDLPRATTATDRRRDGRERPAAVPESTFSIGMAEERRQDVPAMRILNRSRADVVRLQDRVVWQCASLLLAYPDQHLAERLRTTADLRAEAHGPAAVELLERTITALRSNPLIRRRPTTSKLSTSEGVPRCT